VQIPNECPQDVADLIKDCMKSVPEDRPTTREIFHRLRKCSKPRDSGGKGSTTYPGHGTGSSGGTGGSLPANQVSSVAGAPGVTGRVTLRPDLCSASAQRESPTALPGGKCV
jgi:hypothetical protein